MKTVPSGIARCSGAVYAPTPMTIASTDEYWMREALALAACAQQAGEVPVGAVLVSNGERVGSGWNRPIGNSDPSAHAEVVTLRDAGTRLRNYRMPGTVLYVTLEPCVMCAGALVHARVSRVVFGAPDPKGGAAGSVFELLPTDARFNHRVEVTGGVMADESGELLRAFFRAKRSSGVVR